MAPHIVFVQFFSKGSWNKDNLNHILTTFFLTCMHENLEYFERGESRAKPNNLPMLGRKRVETEAMP